MNKKNIGILSVLALLLIALLGFMITKNDSGSTPVQEEQVRSHPASGVKKQAMAKGNKTAEKISASRKASSGPKPGAPIKSGELNWLHIEDAGKLENKEGKKFLVDVYTDWCGWCKVMDKQTFTDPEIQKALNENFHVVKFNAEQKEPIQFDGEKYELVQSGRNGVNALAIKLLGQRLSYPTLVYLDENLNVIKVTRGYKKPDQLMQTLNLIAG
jgi:thioredoxin-related protein